MKDDKTINARALRDPEALPNELRRLAKRASSAEAADIMEHAADELEGLLSIRRDLNRVAALLLSQESSP